MPFPTPRIFKHRDAIDRVPPYSPGDNPKAPHQQPAPNKNSSSASSISGKLKKRAPFRFAERNIASWDLTKMGNKFSSIDNIPRPQRPPRPSKTDLPDLPSLPIYQAFTAKHHPATLLEEPKPPIPEKSASRRSSIVSVAGWPLADNFSSSRGRSTQRESPSIARKYSSASADAAATPRNSSVPRYDRASVLAESYRSLLPDRDSDGLTENWNSTWTGHRPTADPREPREQQEYAHTLHHLGNRSLNATVQPSSPLSRPPEIPHPWVDSPRSSRPRPSSIASSSSLTTVDREHSPVSSSSSEGSTAPSTAPSAGQGRNRRWSLDTDFLQLQQQQRLQHSAPRNNNTPTTNHPPRNQFPPHQRPTTTSNKTSDDVGLQICAEMLTDELRRTFVHHQRGKGGMSKLQVLLLIEAYEATLDNCRREIMRPPLTRGGEGDAARRKHVREAVRILDHWLDCLYRMYDEEFGEEGV
ncbi:hypothetical protein QBC47DRAFT_395387 [Echria macrotheca]|uniref:Uncharacterized protein n=1 Tax=Echria macrotheca TaxID=438768 RepID=A0AAJ0B3Q0_9PEZI|nr:hypothetical protein QBC47DRAFT_395387 [Echria macrotheca]